MKRALILINAYTQSEAELHQPRRIRDELARLNVQAEIVRNAAHARIRGGEIVSPRGYDFCVYLDKDKYAARMLEKAGLRLFNRSSAVEVCDDKMLTHIALAGAGIRMPETLPAPLCYTPESPVSAVLLDEAERSLGYPMIVKECFGSLGKGVYLIRDRASLEERARALKGKPHLFQKWVGESAGRDLRIIAIGGRAVAAMERRSQADFRSNAALGGTCTACPVPPEGEELCRKIASTLSLDFCGIDLLYAREGLTLCEVNSNAFFGAIECVTGVNVAGEYARYLVERVYHTAE